MSCQAVAGGYKCTPGTVTFTAGYDPANPLTTHNWKLDGAPVSTLAQFGQAFPVMGIHTVEHAGGNACGGTCAQTQQLEISDVITPPASTAPAAPASNTTLIFGGLIAVGVLAAVVMSSKK